MSIWLYQDVLGSSESRLGFREQKCPFCVTNLEELGSTSLAGGDQPFGQVDVCQTCGWWKFTASSMGRTMTMASRNEWSYFTTRYGHGTLKNLDISDISTPLAELRSYLLAKQQKIGEVSPLLVENLVADIFRTQGFNVLQTAYSKDGGIDLYLLSKGGSRLSGVEVKRWKGRVDVDAIRSFLAALLIEKMPQGIFVATSGFTRDARSLVKRIATQDLARIELRDSQWMFEALKITQRQAYTSIWDRHAPFRILLDRWETLPIVESGGEEVPWQH